MKMILNGMTTTESLIKRKERKVAVVVTSLNNNNSNSNKGRVRRKVSNSNNSSSNRCHRNHKRPMKVRAVSVERRTKKVAMMSQKHPSINATSAVKSSQAATR